MGQFLRGLCANQQVAALFVIVFGLLFAASTTAFLLSLREKGDGALADRSRARLNMEGKEARFGINATTLFAIVAFFALREFVTLSPTGRGDHRGLVLAFFVVLPLQFWLVATERFDLFTVFIPVYVFLAIPVVSVLAGDPNRFLERNAKLQ